MVNPNPPIFQGGPDFLPTVVVLPVGYPPPPPTPRIYVSQQGDWWDMIAMRVYGMQRGNEHLMFRLIEANYHLRDVSWFPAGVAVFVPPNTDVTTEIPLVPWKSATRIPA